MLQKAMPALMAAVAATSLAACGSDNKSSSKSTASTTTAAAAATPLTAAPTGNYTAAMTTKGLEGKGVVVHDVGNAGTWTMTLGTKKVSMKPPGHEAIVYPVVSVTKDKLTLGPNPLCSTATGRSQKSVYSESAVSGGVRFTVVKAPCPEDGGAIAAGIWKKG
jgi:hypothetical protein